MIKVLTIFAVFAASVAGAAEGVIGFWKTVDDETKEVKSIVRVYEHEGRVYGRVVEIFKNPQATAKLPGNPPIKGLDILWNLKKENGSEKYEGGKVLDPQKGKVYTAQIWRDGDNLVLRGSLFGFGRKQTWLPVQPPIGPLPKLVPSIPVKD